MRFAASTLVTSVLAIAAMGLAACSAEQADESEADQGPTEDALTKGANSDKWVYNGTLPHLENASIVVSRQAHTARVSGLLPANYPTENLPFYAKGNAREVNGRTKIDIVYPVATGSSFNLPKGDYKTERVWPRRTDDTAPWGGFPFISYVNRALSSSVGTAFHGPITSADGEWSLIRGPVSHGCNRMQGEHVVELAHLIGVDMTSKVWSGNSNAGNLQIPVKVLVGEPDVVDGLQVDVDYEARSNVTLPTGNVKKFRTWSSKDFPSWVCRYTGATPTGIPADYCKRNGNVDRFDAISGPPSNGVVSRPVGSCSSASLGRVVEEKSCVQRNRPGDADDRKWFQCAAGEWTGPTADAPGSCTQKFPASAAP